MRASFGRLAQLGEKVVVKHDGDAQQQVAVDAAFLEDAVHGLTVTTQFGCKPCHRALLTLEFFPDGLTNVDHPRLSPSRPHGMIL